MVRFGWPVLFGQPAPGPQSHSDHHYLPLSQSVSTTHLQPSDPDPQSHHYPPPPPSSRSLLYPALIHRLASNLLALITAAIVAAFVLLALWHLRPSTPSRPTVALHRPGQNNLPPSLDWDGACNPFAEHGYVDVHPNDTLRNNWVPFDAQCPPSRILGSLINDLHKFSRLGVDPQTSTRALPWLVNRTVVLFGDSIERFHLRDFCDLLSSLVTPPFHPVSENGFTPSASTNATPSRSFFVTHDSPLAPPPYLYDRNDPRKVPPEWPAAERQMYIDHHQEWATRDNIRTSPWVCEVPAYGLRLVSVFTFGLEPGQAGFNLASQDWYISPPKLLDRLHHILLPLLRSLSHSNSQPAILRPDLIEFSSGLWDLRQYSEEDARLAGVQLDDSTELVYEPLGEDRLARWRAGVVDGLGALDEAFSEGEVGAILWRRLHHPLRHSLAPYSRVEQLDQLGRQIVEDLVYLGQHNHSYTDGDGQGRGGKNRTRLANRLRIDNWGRKMLGMENKMRDPVHPKAVPGSVMWSEMMLWELRRSVLSREETVKVSSKSR